MKRLVAAASFIAAAAIGLFFWLRYFYVMPPFGGLVPMVTQPASIRLGVLREILRSGNDNDPRLDHAFEGLSEEERKSFRAEYRSIPPEQRNQRGTIVYLLGKSAYAPEDWAFLRAVAAEPPCLSLADCGKAEGSMGPGDDVTLAYPSLVALKQAERALNEGQHRKEAWAVIFAGKKSKMPAVVRLAEKLELRFPLP